VPLLDSRFDNENASEAAQRLNGERYAAATLTAALADVE